MSGTQEGHPTPGTLAGLMEALPHWMFTGVLLDAIVFIDAVFYRGTKLVGKGIGFPRFRIFYVK